MEQEQEKIIRIDLTVWVTLFIYGAFGAAFGAALKRVPSGQLGAIAFASVVGGLSCVALYGLMKWLASRSQDKSNQDSADDSDVTGDK